MMDMDMFPGHGDFGHHRQYGYQKPKGFLSGLFGFRKNEMIGDPGMWGDMRGRGPRDFGPPGFDYDPHIERRALRDLSPGRAWMAHRGHMPFDDLHDDGPMDFHGMGDRFNDFAPHRGMGRDHFGRRDITSMTVDGAIAHENAQKGWQENKPSAAGRRAFDDMALLSRRPDPGIDFKPKYKFNSPEHQAHVQAKVEEFGREQEQRNRQFRRDRFDDDDGDFHRHRRERFHDDREFERPRRDPYDDDREFQRHDDREFERPRRDPYDDDREFQKHRSPNRMERRRDLERSPPSMEDDDNPYHHLPAHIPKDDYDNAMKRNLHAWSQWRAQANERAITGEGRRKSRIDSLRRRIRDEKDPDDNGFRLNDPAVLMNYAPTNENSPLDRETFLRYGLPRVRGDGAEDMRGLHEDRFRGRQNRRY